MPTKKQLIERWENVLRVLNGLTPHQRREHWDMGEILYEDDCGTVGCALGHCLLDQWFRRRGMRATKYGYAGWDGVFGYPSTSATEEFFGYEGTSRIFWDCSSRPVSKVIREVKAHIKELRSAD